jgi:hypothetical protein
MTRRKRPRDQREECAIDERVTVNEEQPRRGGRNDSGGFEGRGRGHDTAEMECGPVMRGEGQERRLLGS